MDTIVYIELRGNALMHLVSNGGFAMYVIHQVTSTETNGTSVNASKPMQDAIERTPEDLVCA